MGVEASLKFKDILKQASTIVKAALESNTLVFHSDIYRGASTSILFPTSRHFYHILFQPRDFGTQLQFLTFLLMNLAVSPSKFVPLSRIDR